MGEVTVTTAKSAAALQKIMINQTVEFHFRDTQADRGVITQIFQNQDYNTQRLRRHADIMQHYQEMLAAGDRPLIIDCGANIGASAVYFALNFPEAEIIVVEPDAGNFMLLERNIAGFTRIRALHCAIGSHDGVLDLFDTGEGAWAFRTDTSSGSEIGSHIGEVQCRSLASIMAEVSAAPFLLKIDIEGAEADLFSDNLEPFSAFYLTVVELHDWMLPGQANSRKFLAWHASTDRDFVYIGENVFSIADST